MPADLRRKQTPLKPLIMPIDRVIVWCVILVVLVSIIVILSQVTGFCQMDAWNNGAWR